MSKYYAVAVGRVPGIYRDWASAKLQIDGYSGALFKSFYSEAEANTYMQRNSSCKIIAVCNSPSTTPPSVTPTGSPSFSATGMPFVLPLFGNLSDIKTPTCNGILLTLPAKASKETPNLTYQSVIPTTLPLLNVVTLYTDGSGEGGGYGYGGVIISSSGDIKTYNGPLPYNTEDNEKLSGTNNQAELYAIFMGLSLTKGNIKIFSDSKYAIGCLKDWWPKWEKNGWKDVMNKSLIKACLSLMKERNVTFDHVYSHTGNVYNEMADKQAKLGAKSYIRK